MNWRKHMVLMVGGGIAVLLLVAALVLIFRFQGEYSRVDGDLSSARGRLQQLSNRRPFPSAENLNKMQENLDQVQAMALDLQASLTQAQINGESMEPAEFAPLLERTTRKLQKRAAEVGSTIPEGFAFGFERYTLGELPSPTDVPRLVAQLRSVEALCEILLKAKVVMIEQVGREMFDAGGEGVKSAPAPSSRSRARAAEVAAPTVQVPLVASNELFGVERLSVSFLAREGSVWDALNGIARSPVFMAVVDLQMENTLAASGQLGKKAPPAPIGQADHKAPGGVPPPNAQYPARDDRIVGGREPVSVTLVVDLCRFNPVFQKEAAP